MLHDQPEGRKMSANFLIQASYFVVAVLFITGMRAMSCEGISDSFIET